MKNLNPLTTLTVALCMMITVFFQPPVYALCLFVFIVILSIVSGTIKHFLRNCSKLVFFLVMLFFMQSCLIPGEEILLQVGALKVYNEGFQKAVRLSARLIIFVASCIWFFEVTTAKRLVISLRQRGMSNTAAYVILSAFQMTSQMSRRTKIIMDAQRSRGLETEGNVFIRARAFLPSLAPLLISSLLSTEERALTLEARGFSANAKKTSITTVEYTNLDKIISLISIAFSLCIIAMGVLNWIK